MICRTVGSMLCLAAATIANTVTPRSQFPYCSDWDISNGNFVLRAEMTLQPVA
jgi:hypothetical protein